MAVRVVYREMPAEVAPEFFRATRAVFLALRDRGGAERVDQTCPGTVSGPHLPSPIRRDAAPGGSVQGVRV